MSAQIWFHFYLDHKGDRQTLCAYMRGQHETSSWSFLKAPGQRVSNLHLGYDVKNRLKLMHRLFVC